MKFNKIIFGAAIALSLIGPSVTPAMVNAQTKTNSSQSTNMQNKVDNQKKELDDTIVKLAENMQNQLKEKGKNAKSSQDKNILLKDSQSKEFVQNLKDEANSNWENSIKKNKMSQKQQLKELKNTTNQLKHDINHNKLDDSK